MKTLIDRYVLGGLMLAASFFVARPAQAQPVWTHTAGACVIDENSAAPSTVQESELKFEPAVLGEIVARCNVVNPRDDGQNPLWKVLEVVYRDPDGALLPNQVRVQLKRVTNAGTHITIATFDSNAFVGGVVPLMNSTVFAHVFSFSTGSYWVEIRIKRGDFAGNGVTAPSAFLVRLRQ